MDKSCYNPNQFLDYYNDSDMIQAAVDAAEKTGAKVEIPRYNPRTGENYWSITKAIELHTGSVVILDNCCLRLADGVFCSIFRNANSMKEVANTIEGRQYDIRIMGIGNAVLDGGNHNGLTEKTQLKDGMPSIFNNTLIHLHNVERITIENVRIINQRYWGMTFHFCSEGRISNIDFMAHNNAPNQDGIDLRTGCNRFVIENITGCTGDDTIALTCLDGESERKLTVKDMDVDIHSVIIRNISTYVTGNHAIVRLLNHGGKKLYNIIVENILDRSDGKEFRPGAAVRIGEQRYYSDSGPAKLGDTFGITVRNVVSCARFGVFISCTLQDAFINNVQLYHSAGTGVFFSSGHMRNIHVSDIHYNVNCESSETSLDGGVLFKFDKLCAMYFNDCDCQDLTVRGITAGKALSAVFGGSGNVSLTASGITRLGSETKIVDGESIKVDLGAKQ
ncbi:MAG: hypothetical protein GX783_14010 [Clostridiales bacterium]|nr:hypothetical protein [Clostridiales bacterium]